MCSEVMAFNVPSQKFCLFHPFFPLLVLFSSFNVVMVFDCDSFAAFPSFYLPPPHSCPSCYHYDVILSCRFFFFLFFFFPHASREGTRLEAREAVVEPSQSSPWGAHKEYPFSTETASLEGSISLIFFSFILDPLPCPKFEHKARFPDQYFPFFSPSAPPLPPRPLSPLLRSQFSGI